MQAIEINILEPVITALSTQEGWIGLLLGLGGRETVRTIRAMITTLRTPPTNTHDDEP